MPRLKDLRKNRPSPRRRGVLDDVALRCSPAITAGGWRCPSSDPFDACRAPYQGAEWMERLASPLRPEAPHWHQQLRSPRGRRGARGRACRPGPIDSRTRLPRYPREAPDGTGDESVSEFPETKPTLEDLQSRRSLGIRVLPPQTAGNWPGPGSATTNNQPRAAFCGDHGWRSAREKRNARCPFERTRIPSSPHLRGRGETACPHATRPTTLEVTSEADFELQRIDRDGAERLAAVLYISIQIGEPCAEVQSPQA